MTEARPIPYKLVTFKLNKEVVKWEKMTPGEFKSGCHLQDKLTSSEKNLSTFLFSKFLREGRISAIGGKRLVSNIKLGKMNKPVAPVYKTIKQHRSDAAVFLFVYDLFVYERSYQ